MHFLQILQKIKVGHHFMIDLGANWNILEQSRYLPLKVNNRKIYHVFCQNIYEKATIFRSSALIIIFEYI